MGVRNANQSRRVDRPPDAEMTQTIPYAEAAQLVQTYLQARADVMRHSGRDADARHLDIAAGILTRRARSAKSKLKDERFQIHRYGTQTNDEKKTGRIIFYGDETDKSIIGFMLFESPDEMYDFASQILKGYDALEGLAKS